MYKSIVLFIAFTLSVHPVFSQKRAFAPIAGYLKDTIQVSAPDSLQAWKQRLYNEIRKEEIYECSVLGFSGAPSWLWLKADTLNELSTLDEKLKYFEDLSPVLRIYAFYGILQENDSIAFTLLRSAIKDTTRVGYFCTCVISSSPFNHFLLEDYYPFIRTKYTVGFTTCSRGKCFHFPEPSRRVWKQKEKELKKLLKENQTLLSDVRGY